MAQMQFFGLSYEEVVKKYKQTVGAVCIMRLKSYADAEDCFQNTFFKLYRNPPDFNDEEHLKAWLIRVAINECNKHIRNNKRFVTLENDCNSAVFFPEERCDMSWALLKLDDKYRQVLYLYYGEGYDIKEIANLLEKNENTVKTLMRRGKEKLRKIYGGENDE
ncbi:MAG: RNA polymerase sigma factor [Ruminococcus sp.]|nr:RNA polymerase sigma factor [Ruminococcus sp.]